MYVPNFINSMANLKQLLKPVSGQVDSASAIETVVTGLIPGRVKPKTIKNWYSQLPCLTFNKRDSVKPPPCVGSRCVGGSLA